MRFLLIPNLQKIEKNLNDRNILLQEMLKFGPGPTSIQGLLNTRIAGRASFFIWRGVGGQRIGVREVSGSISGGNTPFYGVSFK